MSYLQTVLLGAVLVALAQAIAPASAALRKTVGVALSVLFLVIVIPKDELGDLFAPLLPSDSETPVISEGGLTQTFQNAVEEGIKLDLCNRFYLDGTQMEVQAVPVKEGDTVYLSSLRVYVWGQNKLSDVPGMVRYLKQTYQTECEVVTDGKG